MFCTDGEYECRSFRDPVSYTHLDVYKRQVPTDALYDVQLLWAFVFLNFFLSIIMSIYSISTYAMNRLDLTSIRSMYADILRIIFLFGTFLLWRPALWLVGAASLISTCYTCLLYTSTGQYRGSPSAASGSHL